MPIFMRVLPFMTVFKIDWRRSISPRRNRYFCIRYRRYYFFRRFNENTLVIFRFDERDASLLEEKLLLKAYALDHLHAL